MEIEPKSQIPQTLMSVSNIIKMWNATTPTRAGELNGAVKKCCSLLHVITMIGADIKPYVNSAQINGNS